MLTTNLLPPEEKYNARMRRIRRTGRFFTILAVGVVLLGTVLLLPSYLFSGISAAALAHSLRLEEEAATRSHLHDAAAAARANAAKVNEVRAFVGSPAGAADLLKSFLNAVPGISIEELAIKEDGSVMMAGIARTRADLLSYESGLRNSNVLESASIPLSTIIQEGDIHFTVQGTLRSGHHL